nr:reverse transcriptase domain-containing protein [Tanacetum cinerariifolium]
KSFPPFDNPELTIRRRSRADPTLLNDFKMAAEGNGDQPVPDLRTMEELCQPSLNGRGGRISPISIQATNFGHKNDMIQQVQNSCQFHGLPGNDANKHLDKFLHVTQSIKVNGVTDDALRLYLFPHSLTHHATTWFDRLPRNSINTFEQMAKMFLVEPEIRTIAEIVPMANRTMEELLQAPTEGYGEAIIILEILAENFEIKTNLLQLIQANKFHSFEKDNPHTHISNFKRMTTTLKYRDVPNDAIKLMLFPYSLEGDARVWYEKEPPNSILTWDDLINKFVNQFFPPSKTTHLKNEISHFTQRFEETFGEAWDRFKEMLRACPHHGFSELTQIDMFYNGLTEQDQDSLNAASSGNLLNKTTREALKIIENKSKVRYSKSKSNVSRVNTNSRDVVSKTDDRIDKLVDQISNLVEIVNKQVITPPNRASHQIPPPGFAPVQNNPNRFNQNQGQGNYFKQENNFNQGNNFRGNNIQNNQVSNNQIPPSVPNEFLNYMKSNAIMIKSMQNQINVLRDDFNKQEENLRRNLNNDMKSILESFFQNQPSTLGTLPSNIMPNPKGEMKAVTTRSGLAYEGPSIHTESPLEKVGEQNTKEVLDKEHSNSLGSTAQVQPSVVPILISEPDVSRTQTKPTIPYPSRLNDQNLREKATNQMEKFFQNFHDLHFDISFADALLLMPKFASIIKRMEVFHALADLGASMNLMPLSIWKKLSLPELTPTRMTLELADRSITHPKGVAEDVFVKVGKFHFPTDFVVVDFEADPRVPLILGRSFLRTGRALIDVYGEEITLRVNDKSITFKLNQTIRYSSTYDDTSVNRVDDIDIACEEFMQDVLDFHYNSKSSGPTMVSDASVSESDSCKEPIVKSSSPTLTPFGETEESKAKSFVEEPPELELKELPSHLEYAFLEDSNKLPVIIAKNLKDNEREALINVSKSHKRAIAKKISDIKGIDLSPWVSPIHCVPKKGDYRKLNDATKKDHFLLPFMDQMLERLVGNEFYCFIPIDPQDQEKTTFTCPYGTFVYRRMPFGLCNAPGHKISKSGIEVNRAKVDVIANLPHLTNIKGVRSFLGHAGFYRRFIQDFSKIARPMTHLLEKETRFVFSKECIDAFDTLKKKLTKAPILVVPDCHLPFELMYDASDYAIGAVLRQCKSKHFQPIHYASKTMTEAQIHYTTTKKEMLVVVYPFEKFWPYLILSKSIVYTDHSALKYLLNKQDAKPRLLRWVLLLQEFDIIILDKKVSENLAADHLSRLENPHMDELVNKDINENFPLETLGSLTSHSTPWFADIANFHINRRCVHGQKAFEILKSFHEGPAGGHNGANLTAKKTASDYHKLQLNELSELRDQAYENSMIYKERTKKLHDSKIKNHIFNVGDQVLLLNSHLKIFSKKLKTRWSGPFTITYVFPYGTIELSQPNGLNFKVNYHRVKHYFGGDIPSNVASDFHTFPMDK